MTVNKTAYPDRETWLSNRHGIGASEAGSVCGVGFKSPVDLWKEKVTGERGPDISDNPRVKFGNDAEEPLRALFRVMHPEYELEFEPYTIYRRDDKYSFMFYTPDGLLTERETGKRGLYESKTSTLVSAQDYAKWKDQVPMGYFCQCLHGMFVADLDFAVLFALLLNREADATVRAYRFDREEVTEDMKWLLEKETQFWRCCETGTMPSTPLIL